jgi:hypothetical protein
METSIDELVAELEQQPNSTRREQIIHALAQVGESAVSKVMQYTKSSPPRPTRHLTAMRVFDKMRYPANKSAIPFMVGIASDPNSPGWEIALDVLKSIGVPIIPEVQRAMRYHSKDLDENSLAIQGLCILIKQLHESQIELLISELLYVFENATDSTSADTYSLWPIRKLGSPKADIFIPLLRERILSKRREGIRRASIEALQDFDKLSVRPLVSILQECLNDRSEAIRNTARTVLMIIGET